MFQFDSNKIYLMPVFFGGTEVHDALATDVTGFNFTLVTDGDRLANYLPPGFTLLQPEITISYLQIREAQFLAGGGYNLLSINVPAHFSGKKDQLDGSFPLVTWENDCRPIIGGREQSGQPKIYADLQDLQIFDNDYFTNASYQNNTFLHLGFSNPQPVDEKTFNEINALNNNYNLFGWRYIPKVSGPGAELNQPILYPQTQKFTEIYTGDASIDWTKIILNLDAYQHDIIVQSNIIAQLADLPIHSIKTALLTKGSLLFQPLNGRVLE